MTLRRRLGLRGAETIDLWRTVLAGVVERQQAESQMYKKRSLKPRRARRSSRKERSEGYPQTLNRKRKEKKRRQERVKKRGN